MVIIYTGTRKEVRVEGVDVLVFWYRNQIYAIEARWAISSHHCTCLKCMSNVDVEERSFCHLALHVSAGLQQRERTAKDLPVRS